MKAKKWGRHITYLWWGTIAVGLIIAILFCSGCGAWTYKDAHRVQIGLGNPSYSRDDYRNDKRGVKRSHADQTKTEHARGGKTQTIQLGGTVPAK